MNAVAQDIERAADAVRAANHSTMRGPLTVAETYAVIGSLVDIAARLPQVLDFLTRSIRRADPAGHIDDRLTSPTDALCQASADLTDAGDDLGQLVRRFTAVHNQLGHLGRLPSED